MINELQIDEYIAKNKYVLDIVTEGKENKYIVKSDTGLGATTAIIRNPSRVTIVVEPLNSIIQKKKESIGCDLEHPVHYITPDTYDYISPLKSLLASPEDKGVYVCTSNRLYEIAINKKVNLEQLKKCSFFIDEMHVNASAAMYRPELPKLLDWIFTNVESGVTLSTATPMPEFCEIPVHLRSKFTNYSITRRNTPPKELRVIPPLPELYLYEIQRNVDLGEKTFIFSNNIHVYHKIAEQFYDCKIQFLIGSTLEPQLAQSATFNYEDWEINRKGEIKSDTEIVVLSTAFATGFDIEYDGHVMVFAIGSSNVDSKSYLDIHQAFGRARKEVLSMVLVYKSGNVQLHNHDLKPFEGNYCQNNYAGLFLQEQANTYDPIYLWDKLINYGYSIDKTELSNTNDFESLYGVRGVKKRVNNLVRFDRFVLLDLFAKVKSKLSIISKSGYSFEFVTIYAVAYTLKVYEGNKYINDLIDEFQDGNENNRIQLPRVVDALFRFYLSRNKELSSLFNSSKFGISGEKKTRTENKGSLTERNYTWSDRVFDAYFDIKSDSSLERDAMLILTYAYFLNHVDIPVPMGDYAEYVQGKRKIKEHIDKKLEQSSISLRKLLPLIKDDLTTSKFQNSFRGYTKEVKEQLKNLLKTFRDEADARRLVFLYHELDENEKYREKRFKGHHLFMLSKLIKADKAGFGVRYDRYREFNPSTLCPRYLRNGPNPFPISEYDISSCNAQFIDERFGTNIWRDVYGNVMREYELTRIEAKRKYNIILNNPKMRVSTKKEFLVRCGYPADKAEEIALFTNQVVDGVKFYHYATQFEQQKVRQFRYSNNLRHYVRIHDAVILIEGFGNEVTNVPDGWKQKRLYDRAC
jgi:hypothetical protein